MLELLPVGSAKSRPVDLGAVIFSPSRVRNSSRHLVHISDLGKSACSKVKIFVDEKERRHSAHLGSVALGRRDGSPAQFYNAEHRRLVPKVVINHVKLSRGVDTTRAIGIRDATRMFFVPEAFSNHQFTRAPLALGKRDCLCNLHVGFLVA